MQEKASKGVILQKKLLYCVVGEFNKENLVLPSELMM